MRLLSFLFICVFILLSPAYAQRKGVRPPSTEISAIEIPEGDFSKLKHTKSGRIDKIIDGLTLLLKDGTIIRLSSIDIPDFHIWNNAHYSESALEILEKTLPEGTEVLVYQTRMAKKGRITRMKHKLAHILTKKNNIWMQGLLLGHGLARVQITPSTPEMAAQMFTIEKEARKQKRGLWEDESEYHIKDPTPEALKKYMGEFVIVEGVVQKTASVRNNIYLNFGDNWRTDFTIMITPTLRKKLAHNHIAPLGMNNERVRVRGWLKDYNGPLIELDDPLHLEVLLNKTPLQGNVEKPNLPP